MTRASVANVFMSNGYEATLQGVPKNLCPVCAATVEEL